MSGDGSTFPTTEREPSGAPRTTTWERIAMSLTRRAAAECFGTLWLVLGGCGSAVLTAKFPETGIGFLGVAFAFGLSLLTMAYAIGPISGCHVNPAVSVGLAVGGRFPARELPHYVVAQLIGACLGAAILYVVASGSPTFDVHAGFATNGYGDRSPGGYGVVPALVAEGVLTFGFVFVILAATEERAPKGFAPIAIGLALTMVHLIDIPVTNASVNPARSTGPALFVGAPALEQLWLFWVAPLVGAALAGLAYPALTGVGRAARPAAPTVGLHPGTPLAHGHR